MEKNIRRSITKKKRSNNRTSFHEKKSTIFCLLACKHNEVFDLNDHRRKKWMF